MKTFTKSILGGSIQKIAAATLALTLSMSANATPVAGTSLQSIIDGLYTAGGTSTSLAPDVNANQYALDERWMIGGSGGSLSTFIIQIAGLATSTTFGIYDSTNSSNKVQLFDGAAPLVQGDQVLVGIHGDGSVFKNISIDTGVDFAGNLFGYYLQAGTTTFYSEAALNGGSDQMVAYEGDGDLIKISPYLAGPWGSNEYILAWEDITYAASDKDFDDFVVLVESVSGVPEPGSLALLGLGLAGLGALSRRKVNSRLESGIPA